MARQKDKADDFPDLMSTEPPPFKPVEDKDKPVVPPREEGAKDKGGPELSKEAKAKSLSGTEPRVKKVELDKGSVTLVNGGWFERDGRWYCPSALAYRGEDGQMVIPAKDSHFTKEEALELEAKRHKQPPLA